jgi:hypothetical protein
MSPKVAKKRGTKAEPEATTTSLVPLKGGEDVSVMTQDETFAMKVHDNIIGLLRQHEQTYFALAEQLWHMREGKLYRHLDGNFKCFKQYVQESLGFDPRKARYLTLIWWWFGIQLQADATLLEQAHEIGWTKTKELVCLVDRDNAPEWFQMARDYNATKLAKAASAACKEAGIKRSRMLPMDDTEEDVGEEDNPQGNAPFVKKHEPKPAKSAEPMKLPDGGGTGGEEAGDEPEEQESEEQPEEAPKSQVKGVAPPKDIDKAVEKSSEEAKKWKNMTFAVHDEFKGIINEALQCAQDTVNSDHRGYLLSHICLHFSSYYTTDFKHYIGSWLEKIERVTGLKLIAVDLAKKEFVFGEEFADKYLRGQEESDEGQ